MKFLAENRGENFFVILGKDFLDVKPKTQSRNEKIYNWTFIKLKTYVLQKTLLREDKSLTGRIFANFYMTRDLYLGYILKNLKTQQKENK